MPMEHEKWEDDFMGHFSFHSFEKYFKAAFGQTSSQRSQSIWHTWTHAMDTRIFQNSSQNIIIQVIKKRTRIFLHSSQNIIQVIKKRCRKHWFHGSYSWISFTNYFLFFPCPKMVWFWNIYDPHLFRCNRISFLVLVQTHFLPCNLYSELVFFL